MCSSESEPCLVGSRLAVKLVSSQGTDDWQVRVIVIWPIRKTGYGDGEESCVGDEVALA